jgi:hypothetical protein
MDSASLAAATVAALSPYLAAAAKKTAEKVGEATYENGAKLVKFLKRKLSGENDQKALSRVEENPEDADNQAALRVVLKESLQQDTTFQDELEALLNDLPENAMSLSANVVGDNDVVNQAAGQNINIAIDRK